MNLLIFEDAVNLYSDLYISGLEEEGADVEDFLEGLPMVDKDSNNELQQNVSLQEFYTAMMTMENGKSPGIDGLTVEFYKTLWPAIGEELLAVFKDCLKKENSCI